MTASAYLSPYKLRFSVPQPLLEAGFGEAPWDDAEAESDLPFAAWQAQHADGPGAAWGPPARHYPAPSLPRDDDDYRRERVISVAARYLGLDYQHHHVPSWHPPEGWPWLKVKSEARGPGLDCSNFSSFVFNYALGVKLPTSVSEQGGQRVLQGPGGAGCLTAELIPASDVETLTAQLRPADLLYFRNEAGKIRHVAFWLGPIGQAPGQQPPVPLVIDCTQLALRDRRRVEIPAGVQLRPFRREGWYAKHLSHAHRLIGAAGAPCQGTPPAAPEGDDRS